MLRKLLLIALLALACGANDARQVQAYLAVTDQVMTEFMKLGEAYEGLGTELEEKVRAERGNPERLAALATAMEPRVRDLADRSQKLLDRVNQQKAPKPALAFHRALVGTLESFQKAVKAYGGVTAEMKKGAQADKARLAQLGLDMRDHLQGAMAEAGVASDERRRLIDQYAIKLDGAGLVPAPK